MIIGSVIREVIVISAGAALRKACTAIPFVFRSLIVFVV
jgi:hypothetical protein